MNPEITFFREWRNRVIAMILLFLPVCALSQDKGTEVVIHLKNHFGLTEVHGTLIPMKDSNKIAIRTRDKNVWVFSRSDVKNISREKLIFPLTPHGWYNTTTAAIYFGDNMGYQIQSVAGYRFHYRYYAGMGVAIDDYTIRTLPVFADFRADLLKEQTTPFAYMDIGLTDPWPKNKELKYGKHPDKKIPGWYFNMGIGWRFRGRRSGHSWQLSMGYSLETMKLKYIQPYNGGIAIDPDPMPANTLTNTYKYTFNRFVIKAGFTL